MDIHVYHHFVTDEQTSAMFGAISQQLNRMEAKMSAISDAFDALVLQVTSLEGTIDGGIAVINSIADRIEAAGTDPVALAALTTQLRTKDEALAAAIAAVPPAA